MDRQYHKLLFIAAVYGVAANLVHPVTPTLITRLNLPDASFGYLFAAMALGNFLLGPFWGQLADRRGRVVVLAISLFGYGVAQFVFGMMTSLIPMILARFVSGLFTGGTGVALMAMIVDCSDVRSRAKNLSTYAAVNSVTSSAGYFLGGVIGVYSLIACFALQSALLILAALISRLMLRDAAHPVAAPTARRADLQGLKRMLTPTLILFLLAVALATFGTNGYDNAFNYYLRREFDFNSSVNGTIKAVTGILGFLANLFLIRLILKRFSGRIALTLLLTACAAMLIVVTRMPNAGLFIAMNIVFYLFNAMYVPIQQSLLADGRQGDYGMLSGLFSSAKGLGMITGALVSGALYSHGAKLPFYALAASFALAAIVTYVQGAWFFRRREQTTLDSPD